MSSDSYYIYILTNKNRTVLYTGVTNSLRRRLAEHKEKPAGFVKRYGCNFLIYFESFTYPKEAILREKEIKKWRREKKEILIATYNPEWLFKDDLFL